MKRTFALFITVLLILATFVGCGNDETPSRGVWNEDQTQYENTYAGLKFKLPDNWEIQTDEEIAETMQIGAETMGLPGGEFSKEILKMKIITDTIMQNPTTGESIMIAFENLSLVAGGKKMEPKEIFDSIIDGVAMQDGLKINPGEPYQIDAFGQTYDAIDVNMEVAGIVPVEINQRYYIRKIGNYLIIISITATPATDSIDNLLDSITIQ